MSEPGFVTLRQLRLLAALEATLLEVLGIELLHNGERRPNGRFRFGEEEDVPGTPFLELTHWDFLAGDGWSGSNEDWDVFRLRDARDRSGRSLDLTFESVTNSLAGYCAEFTSGDLPDDVLTALSEAYARHRRADPPPSPDFRWMLHTDERASLA